MRLKEIEDKHEAAVSLTSATNRLMKKIKKLGGSGQMSTFLQASRVQDNVVNQQLTLKSVACVRHQTCMVHM